MTPYTTLIQSKHLLPRRDKDLGLDDFGAERVFREFKRVEQGIRVLSNRIDAIKDIKRIHQVLRTGLVSATTTNTIEPFAFGDPGVVLEQFTLINSDVTKIGGTIISLELSINASLSSTTAGTTANAKALFKFGGSPVVNFSPMGTVIGTTPGFFFAILDLTPFRGEFINGDLFFGIGMWISAGAGLIQLGDSSETEPNMYAEISYEVELP